MFQLFINCPYLATPRQQLMTCARETLDGLFQITISPLTNIEKKHLVGREYVTFQNNVKLFSAVESFTSNSFRFAQDRNQ